MRLTFLLCLVVVCVLTGTTQTITSRNVEPSAIISTVAGSNSLGDGLLATEAWLAAPRFFKIMSNGEIFICDSTSIRKLLTNGTIITVVSNLTVAGDAQKPTVTSLDVDMNGDIYVSDYVNCKIKKVSNGVVSTFAGNGGQGIGTDGGLAINSIITGPHTIMFHPISNELYISQPVVNKIRKIDINNIVSTVAGTSSPTYGGDGGPAVDAYLFGPSFMTFDASGNLYISDSYNKRVRMVNYGDGTISTVAQGGSNIGGVAVNPLNGDLFVGIENSIYKVSNEIIRYAGLTSWAPIVFSGDGGLAVDARLNGPSHLAVSPSGLLYIADSGNFRIRKVSADGKINTIAGGGIGNGKSATDYGILKTPKDVAIGANGELLIADFTFGGLIRNVSNNIIITIAGEESSSSEDGQLATQTRIIGIESLVRAPNGDIYITEQCKIRKLSKADGKFYTIAGTGILGNSPDGSLASSSQIGMLSGIGFNSLGEVIFSDYFNNCIRKVSTSGMLVTIVGGAKGFSGDGGLATNANINNPNGLTVTSTDDIYFVDSSNYRIRKISSNGIISTIVGTGSPSFINPGFVALNFKGEVFFSDRSQRIRKFTTDGNIVNVAGVNGNAGFSGDGGLASNSLISSPLGLSVDSNGHVYFADSGNNRIRKITYTCPENYGLVALQCIPMCFGIISSNQSVCSTRGQCNEPNTCSCNSPYFGKECEIFECYGVVMNSSLVCSSHGSCRAPNTCKCDTGYYDNNCKLYNCGGIQFNSSRVCSSHGNCVSPNTCVCGSGYSGTDCEQYNCSGIAFNTPQVCSTHGVCASPDNCTCSQGYYGKECEMYKCSGVIFNSSQVCLTHGVCSAPDTCQCSGGYYGINCEQHNCSLVNFNSSLVCSSHGLCILPDTCNCSSSDYYGNNCQYYNCSGVVNNSPQVCSAHGICDSPNHCKCSNGYQGEICELFNCSGISYNSSNVCSSRGLCLSPDNCKCNSGYFGIDCEMFACSGVNYTLPQTCSSRGHCILPDMCECSSPNYFGNNCQHYNCSGIINTSPKACSSHGSCIEVNNCSCSTGYYGSECEHYTCSGMYFNSSQVCSSRGVCTAPDTCKCSNGYYGQNCELFNCSSVVFNSPQVCSSHGSCILPEICNCSSSDYYGNNCQYFNCSGVVNNSSQVCSAHGMCVAPHNCSCNSGYYGEVCELFSCFGIEHSNGTLACSGNGKCMAPNTCQCSGNFHGSKCEAQQKCTIVNNSTECTNSSLTPSINIWFSGILILLLILIIESLI